MNRAYSVLEIKSTSDAGGKRTFTGIASTITTDRQGDIVEPKGALFNLPLPFLWQHDSMDPIGWITSAKVSAKGITVDGEIADIPEPGHLKDRLLMAWQMLKSKLVRGLSIGFMPIESEPINPKDPWGGSKFLSWEWLELSAVTIPANAEASIQTVKSIDQKQMAASGKSSADVVRLTNSPGVTGNQTPQTGKGKQMNTQEQIASFEAKRAASAAALEAIMAKSAEEGATLDSVESEKYDTLKAEVVSIDKHLDRLREHEKSIVIKANPVTIETGNDEEKSNRVRFGDAQIKVNPNVPKGTAFIRYAMALGNSKGNIDGALRMARVWKESTPEVYNVLEMANSLQTTKGFYLPETENRLIKATIAAGNTTDANWASPLVQYTNMAAEFVALLRPKTILGNLTSLRHVPFNIRFASATSGTTMAWVGQGLGKPVSKMQLATNTLGFAKAAGIVVITKELAMLSSPSAEAIVREDMLNQMSQFLDQQFIDPGVAAVANVSPASITNGATAIQSTYVSTLLQSDTDIAAALNTLLAAEIPFSSLAWVMTPYTAMKMGMLRTTNGDFAYSTISASGGTLAGIPVIVSNNVPHSTSAGSIIVLLAQPEIFVADDGGVELDVSDQASVEMSDAPTATGAGTGASLVSLWQENLVGLRAERMINWQRRRTTAVVYIDNVHF